MGQKQDLQKPMFGQSEDCGCGDVQGYRSEKDSERWVLAMGLYGIFKT